MYVFGDSTTPQSDLLSMIEESGIAGAVSWTENGYLLHSHSWNFTQFK